MSIVKTQEQVNFRLVLMPCCGTMLCWINPRYPNFCPECGKKTNNGWEGVLLHDPNSILSHMEGAFDIEVDAIVEQRRSGGI